MGELSAIDFQFMVNKKSDVKDICSPLKGKRGVFLSVQLQQKNTVFLL